MAGGADALELSVSLGVGALRFRGTELRAGAGFMATLFIVDGASSELSLSESKATTARDFGVDCRAGRLSGRSLSFETYSFDFDLMLAVPATASRLACDEGKRMFGTVPAD